jgi:hypothetical protein
LFTKSTLLFVPKMGCPHVPIFHRPTKGADKEKGREERGRGGEEEGISYDENSEGDVKPVMSEVEERRGWYGRNLHWKVILE